MSVDHVLLNYWYWCLNKGVNIWTTLPILCPVDQMNGCCKILKGCGHWTVPIYFGLLNNIHKCKSLKVGIRKTLFLSPPVQSARWAHMHHVLSVCLWLDQNYWTVIHISKSIAPIVSLWKVTWIEVKGHLGQGQMSLGSRLAKHSRYWQVGLHQCWKFLSPGRPRLPDLGLGDILPEASSPGRRPKNPISQLL